MIVQLLHKLSIRGVNGSEKLLRVIKVSSSLSSCVEKELTGRTPSLTISPRIPSNSVCPLFSLLFQPISDTHEPSLTHSPIRRRTYYPIIPVPPHTTRNTFYRRLRRSHGKGVSPFFLCSVHFTLSVLHRTTHFSPAPPAWPVDLANRQCGQLRRSIR